MAFIVLSTGSVCLLDDSDLPLIVGINWVEAKKGQRVQRLYARGRDKKSGKKVYLHRLVLSANPGEIIDHINGDGLDNRRVNLRRCTTSQNNANSRWPTGRSGYRGVSIQGSRYIASISIGNKTTVIGVSRDILEAARLYDDAALRHFGEFATLNFPSLTHTKITPTEPQEKQVA